MNLINQLIFLNRASKNIQLWYKKFIFCSPSLSTNFLSPIRKNIISLHKIHKKNSQKLQNISTHHLQTLKTSNHQLLNQVAKVLKFSLLEETLFCLALHHSQQAPLKKLACNQLRSKLPQLISRLLESGENGKG